MWNRQLAMDTMVIIAPLILIESVAQRAAREGNLLSAFLCPEPFRWWLLLLYSLLSREDRVPFAMLPASTQPWGACNLSSSGGGSGGGGKSAHTDNEGQWCIINVSEFLNKCGPFVSGRIIFLFPFCFVNPRLQLTQIYITTVMQWQKAW